jgi:hypothetical protein
MVDAVGDRCCAVRVLPVSGTLRSVPVLILEVLELLDRNDRLDSLGAPRGLLIVSSVFVTLWNSASRSVRLEVRRMLELLLGAMTRLAVPLSG